MGRWEELDKTKWRWAREVLCDNRVSIKLKDTFYKTVARSAVLYGTEGCVVKTSQERKMQVSEMRRLRYVSGDIPKRQG